LPGGKPIIQQAQAKKPLIVEMKDVPNVTESVQDDKLVLTILTEKEGSAKDIDLDVSESELKLKSEHYALSYRFKRKVDPDSVTAKFSKAKKTLTLTFD
jgi:hypothetical protein